LKEKNVRKCSFSPGNCKSILKKVVHRGGEIMQHVFTLRKIFLIFGFALAAFGCDTDKDFDEAKEVLAVQSHYSYSANGE
jgi:hypothetical protein